MRGPRGAVARRAERDVGSRLDPERVTSSHDRKRGCQWRRLRRLPGASPRPNLGAGRRGGARQLPAHKVAGLAKIVAVRGVHLLYLLPYSPDFNPIELAFSKLKIWLRTA